MALNAAAIADKWGRRAGSAAPDYKIGVTQTTKDQAQLAISAKDIYAAALSESIAEDRFAKGLAKAGTQKWRNKASGKGVINYTTGVSSGKNDYQTGVQPYLSALDSVVLPPRGPRRSPNNINRVVAVNQAMIAVKMAQ